MRSSCEDSAYQNVLCASCGRTYQSIDFGCAVHRLMCHEPIRSKVVRVNSILTVCGDTRDAQIMGMNMVPLGHGESRRARQWLNAMGER